VDTWDLTTIPTGGGATSPVVLATEDQARAVLIGLEPGQELGEHEVKEGAWIVVIEGRAELSSGTDVIGAGPGVVARFAPGERREVRSETGARLLLFLAPWPGAGHYSAEEREVG
jgi:quercetin dioxygenase-like cupin family protein